jgi:arylsulfatase
MTGPNGEPFPANEMVRPWDTLSDDEKKLFCRMAEVYAGFLSYTDHEIGRLLDYLEESGQLENTIIVALSDNGASGEGGPNGSVNENKFFNGVPDTIEENMKYLDLLGSEKTYNHYSLGWAMAFNTPNKLWKRWASYEGGVADPFIISWPKGIQARGEIRHQYIHAIDIVPTIYECLGIQPPEVVKGYTQAPIEGVTFRQTFDDASAPTNRETQFYVMLGTRGIWHRGWHACATHPPAPSNWGHFGADTWELYHLDEDRSQARDVAAQFPEKLEELKNLWWVEAGRYNGLPLEDRTAIEILTTPRPQLSKPRQRYVYYSDVADVPEAVAVNVRNRSYSILAEVELETPEAAGVLFAHGGRFGGHALYLKDGKLHYVYNWLGEVEQKITSSEDVSVGKSVLGVKFDKTGMDGPAPTGTATLYIDDKAVGSAEIKTQLGNFSLVGEGLCVGRDGGQPVSSDYESPFHFAGGVIKQVVVDVSGEPYADLEKEAIGAFARE